MDPLESVVATLAAELDTINAELSSPDVARDPGRLRDLSRRQRRLTAVVGTWRELADARADVGAADELLTQAEGEERDQLAEDRERAVTEAAVLEARLQDLKSR